MGSLWEKLIRPILFRLDAERAHKLGMTALRSGFAGKIGYAGPPPEVLARFGTMERFGHKFNNPIGLAAGFDKNCEAVEQIAALGFGFIEVGTVTFQPQPGNPKPRIFRLPHERALINRLGFNNDGAFVIAERLSQVKRDGYVIGVNIGRNKDISIEGAIDNYLQTFTLVSPFADYVTVNVSSPNTPDLRELQHGEHLENLLAAIQQSNDRRVPLLVKIAPDLSEAEVEAIVDISFRQEIAGIIATNTTISRDGIDPAKVSSVGAGGLSGRPLEKRSTEVISTIYRHSKGNLPIVGVGGVFDGQDAFEKIAAGASLIQCYTGFVYGGPTFPRDVVMGLAKILDQRGFRTLDEAVGSGVPK